MKNYSKAQCEAVIINTFKKDRQNAIMRLASSALYASFNPAEAKKGLQDIYIKQGFVRVVKGNIYHSQQADIDIKAAIKLSDLNSAELFEIVKEAPTEKALYDKVYQFITLKYAPESLPLKINNKFLPMLTEGYTLEQAQEEFNGKTAIEGNNPEGTNNDEGEAEGVVNAGTDKAELTPAKEKKTNVMLFKEHSQAIIEMLKNLNNRDKPLLLEALSFVETLTRSTLLSLENPDLVKADKTKIVLTQGEPLAIDLIGQKLTLARKSVDAVSKPEIVIKKKGTKTKKVYVSDAVSKITANNPAFQAA